MKKYLFSLLLSIVIFYTYTHNSNNVSSGNGYGSCNGCHSASSNTTVDSIRLINLNTGAIMTGYYPDSTYQFVFYGKNTGSLTSFGFISRVVNNSNAVVGTFQSPPSGTGTLSSATLWTHSSVQNTGSQFTKSCNWKAPTGQGQINLQAIINAVNNSGTNAGDNVSSSNSFTLPVLGVITNLNCGSGSTTGTLNQGTAASGVSFSIPYSGGNSGPHSGQIVSSTGVGGLTATLSAGNFTSSTGNLTYTVSGTPTGTGTANFALNIGTKSCTYGVTVNGPLANVTSLNCTGGRTTGPLYNGSSSSGVSIRIPYTGGNTGSYTTQNVSSSGVTGLTATLTAGNLANGSDTLTYTLSGTPTSSGTASFTFTIGTQSCTYNTTVQGVLGTVTSITCGAGSTTGSLYAGATANGVSFSVPYNGGNGGVHNGQTVSSTGVTGLTATISAGNFNSGSGNLVYTVSGVPNATGTASFNVNMGGQSCTYTISVAAPDGTIDTLKCNAGSSSGTLYSGVAASGVSFTIPYINGNGKIYPILTSSSTGVTGLTATKGSDTFITGNGSLTYTVTGTPSSTGLATFTLNAGGKYL